MCFILNLGAFFFHVRHNIFQNYVQTHSRTSEVCEEAISSLFQQNYFFQWSKV